MLIVLLLGRNLKYQLPTKNEWKTFLTSLHIVMGSVIGLSMRSVMWLVIAPVIGFIMIQVATSGNNLFEKKLPSDYERVQAAAEY